MAFIFFSYRLQSRAVVIFSRDLLAFFGVEVLQISFSYSFVTMFSGKLVYNRDRWLSQN